MYAGLQGCSAAQSGVSLTGLRRLSLSRAPITDALLLAVVCFLSHLTELESTLCELVTDKGARQLTGLKQLKRLRHPAVGLHGRESARCMLRLVLTLQMLQH